MFLTILGCRQGMPADGQSSSGYLVSTSTTRLLLDCGPGAATALSAVAHPSTLSGVFISHFHTDHCFDLLPVGKTLLNGRVREGMDFPTLPHADKPVLPAVPLHVPQGGKATLRTMGALFPVPSFPMLEKAFEVAFDVREYSPGDVFTIGDCTISLHSMNHSLPNCGIRVDSPEGSLAYTGDTRYTDAMVQLARDVDLFLCEATLEVPDTSAHGHLSAIEAGEVAKAADVGELVLTHFVTSDQSWLDARKADAERVYDGPVHLAAPGLTFDVQNLRKAKAER